MTAAREAILQTLTRLRTFLAQESVPRLSEADTKANFIEPLIAALGWSGIGVVTREYYVRNSQEFIDYAMASPSASGAKPVPLLAIEAKALQSDLTEKNAAQLIQYCSVEGIEWAALTNGRDLQLFNTFLKPDLSAKRILRLDLLAFNDDDEFGILFDQLWQLSRGSMTTEGSRAWLNQLRLDRAVREIMVNPSSSTIRYLRRALVDAEVKASPQELVQWFRAHLTSPVTRIGPTTDSGLVGMVSPEVGLEARSHGTGSDRGTKSVEGPRVLLEELRLVINQRFPDVIWRELKYYDAAEVNSRTFMAVKARSRGLVIGLTLPDDVTDTAVTDNTSEFNWRRITKVVRVQSSNQLTNVLVDLIDLARQHADIEETHQRYGVTLSDLIKAGVVKSGTSLVFTSGPRDLARAILSETGQIIWEGQTYQFLSDKAFARLLGPTRTSVNGWTHWVAELPTGRRSLADLRADVMARDGDASTA